MTVVLNSPQLHGSMKCQTQPKTLCRPVLRVGFRVYPKPEALNPKPHTSFRNFWISFGLRPRSPTLQQHRQQKTRFLQEFVAQGLRMPKGKNLIEIKTSARTLWVVPPLSLEAPNLQKTMFQGWIAGSKPRRRPFDSSVHPSPKVTLHPKPALHSYRRKEP